MYPEINGFGGWCSDWKWRVLRPMLGEFVAYQVDIRDLSYSQVRHTGSYKQNTQSHDNVWSHKKRCCRSFWDILNTNPSKSLIGDCSSGFLVELKLLTKQTISQAQLLGLKCHRSHVAPRKQGQGVSWGKWGFKPLGVWFCFPPCSSTGDKCHLDHIVFYHVLSPSIFMTFHNSLTETSYSSNRFYQQIIDVSYQ